VPSWATLKWEPNLGAFGGRRARQGFHYRAYVPDPIVDLDVGLPADVAAAVVDAEVAVRQLNEAGIRLRSLESLARQLLRAESVASSRIEGLQLSHRRLARVDYARDARDVTAQSVLANMRAMELAVRRASKKPALRVSDIQAIHRELFAAFKDPAAGRLRTEQSWIGGASSSPRDAEFVPPPPEHVPKLMKDLAEFLERDDLPAAVQSAIAHAQFETIHPFADGNGRVGRCLIHVVLRRRGIAPHHVPPVSLILATNSRAYIGGLTEFRKGNVAEWCAVFAQALRTSARRAEDFSAAIEKLKARWLVLAGEPRAGSAARGVIELLPSHPILNVGAAERALKISNQAARLAMLQLAEAKVIEPITTGRRNRAWEASGLFKLIDQFEVALATRGGGSTRLRPAPR
jgi:Fic family protein